MIGYQDSNMPLRQGYCFRCYGNSFLSFGQQKDLIVMKITVYQRLSSLIKHSINKWCNAWAHTCICLLQTSKIKKKNLWNWPFQLFSFGRMNIILVILFVMDIFWFQCVSFHPVVLVRRLFPFKREGYISLTFVRHFFSRNSFIPLPFDLTPKRLGRVKVSPVYSRLHMVRTHRTYVTIFKGLEN